MKYYINKGRKYNGVDICVVQRNKILPFLSVEKQITRLLAFLQIVMIEGQWEHREEDGQISVRKDVERRETIQSSVEERG